MTAKDRERLAPYKNCIKVLCTHLKIQNEPVVAKSYTWNSEYNVEGEIIFLNLEKRQPSYQERYVRRKLLGIGITYTEHNSRLFSLLHEFGHFYDQKFNSEWFMNNVVNQRGIMHFLTSREYKQLPLERSANRHAVQFLKLLQEHYSYLVDSNESLID